MLPNILAALEPSVGTLQMGSTDQIPLAPQTRTMTTATRNISDGMGVNFKPNSKELLEGKAPTQEYFLNEYAKEDWIAPWDIGKAQPNLVKAEEEGLAQGRGDVLTPM